MDLVRTKLSAALADLCEIEAGGFTGYAAERKHGALSAAFPAHKDVIRDADWRAVEQAVDRVYVSLARCPGPEMEAGRCLKFSGWLTSRLCTRSTADANVR